MRSTFDLPDELMRQLKARAALEGRSLRDLLLELIERGLNAPALAADPKPSGLPTVRIGRPLSLPASSLNHADLSELAQD